MTERSLPSGEEAQAMIAEARKALWVMVGFLALIWIVQIFNWAADYRLSFDFGIESRNVGSLPEIFTAPFLHGSWGHIEGNSGPLFIFGFLAAYRGVRKFFAVTALIIVGSGLGVWFIAGENTVTVGASGVVLGYFGYIIVRGLFDRRPIDIVIGLVMALCFAYQFAALLPAEEGISWQGHLFGFAAGVIGGWVFRERRRKQVEPAPAGPTITLDPPTP
ncbi:membrane associated rhomboid family serine protease [Amycolatopsis endophytica]|uniref:Membrane associated rhomboid family serine protease n=1 Tax=Amycolatopsis endophytica TaxID=860233 RepID=A0A853B2F9_9PSEU|nr:rhomboid family intramembrane serine protease [Amycolatopsis endophytica]NYI89313.1 membrane associated rhomboid family serine protease [Amycolatopsis endophytica]